MRKAELREKERLKYETIKKLVETSGSKKRASVKLGCTLRTVDNLIKRYLEKGKFGFIHGNRGRAPAIAISENLKEKIIEKYKAEYQDTNFQHYSEIVYEDFGVSVCRVTLNKWLREENVLSPKARKRTKRELKKALKKKLEAAKSKTLSDELKEMIERIDENNAHPRRSRSKYFGEMIQMDASSFEWIKGEVWHLHVAVDDATSQVIGAYFDKQETLKGYYHVFYQILKNYGIPYMFYTDKRSVFEYKKKRSAFDEQDTFTQFAYACKQLGIEIKTTSVPQAKGRIERMNQTLQSRIPVELRRHGIKTIEQANDFLSAYWDTFNEKFSLYIDPRQTVFEVAPSDEDIMKKLAVISERKIDNGHCVKFMNRFYIPIDENGSRVYLMPKTECLMIQAFDRRMYLSAGNCIYAVQEIVPRKKVSENFDAEKEKTKRRKVYIPPMSHPWRRQTFVSFKQKQRHRQEDRC